MGEAKKPDNVKLIAAVLFQNENQLKKTLDILKNKFGNIDNKTEIFEFCFSDYYENEMGKNLKKLFISFEKLIDREKIPDIKIFTNKFELEMSEEGNRCVNIDPGYIEEPKLVLATTKNFAHRIYLSKNIYGDVHLVWQNGEYLPQAWTYPDYKEPFSLKFFTDVRNNYIKDLKSPEKIKHATYKDAGVDIDHGDTAVDKIKESIKSTFNKNVLVDLGKFGGFYKIDKESYKNPIIVSSMDGVGTKLMVASLTDKHDSVGEDLVNHCVNDILCCGAEPLFFLDYFGAGKLEVNVHNEVLKGFIRGCRNNNCALIGGETAEMPDLYSPGDYDLCGCIIGAVEKDNILDGGKIKSGDKLIGLSSNGFHTNGYSLIRKVFFEINNYSADHKFPELEFSLGEELLRVHRSYKNLLLPLIKQNKLSGLSHITGGGIEGNTNRLLSGDMKLKIDWNSWEWPQLFSLTAELGNIEIDEMRRVFNLGIGIILIVSDNNYEHITDYLNKNNEKHIILGEVI